MNLKEYQARELFKEYDINTPKSALVRDVKNIDELDLTYKLGKNTNEFVVKAQILQGNRLSKGAVKFVDKKNLKKAVKSMLTRTFDGESVDEVLVQEKIYFKEQFYLALTIDRTEKSIILIFSKQGGTGIEQKTEKVRKLVLDDSDENATRNKIRKFFNGNKKNEKFVILTEKMLKLMKEKDCELVEINPLVLVHNELIALDAKITIDENALFRHDEFSGIKNAQLNELEKEAARNRLHFVQLKGDIGVIGNGAGLVMATLDAIDIFGGKPANFLDLVGGTGSEIMKNALKIILQEKPKKLLINIFGGITRCDEIASALIDFKDKHKVKIPFVVRFIGTNEKQAIEILEKNNLHSEKSMEDAVKKVVTL